MFFLCFFFFNDTATTEIYTLSLHDALPIFGEDGLGLPREVDLGVGLGLLRHLLQPIGMELEDRLGGLGQDPLRLERGLRSEEHTSELQSRQYLVCRLLLEKKKKYNTIKHVI